MRRLLPILAAGALWVGACSGDGPGPTGRADGPSLAGPSGSAGPPVTTTTTLSPLPLGPAQPATDSCPAVPGQTAPDPDRPRYTMSVRVLPGEAAVEGRLTVRFRPDLATDRLVFRLWPNGPRPAAAGAHLEVGPVFLGAPVPVPTDRPDPTTLVVPLESGLGAGDLIEATMPWRLSLPGNSDDRLAHSGDAIRLGSFFPVLAWEPGVGWATDPPTAGLAETSMAPVADFAYSVTVPDGLDVLASGVREGSRWRAAATRDIAISIGRFRTAEAEARAPGPVAVTVGVHESLDEDPEAYLTKVVDALEDFARRFGPHPYPTYTLALTPGLSGGVEYPGHVMQGPGTLARTTSHEVAHQWFYSLVGNHQGRDPWLDEGLATWAEARFENSLDRIVDRSVPSVGRDQVGRPMAFWDDHPAAYYRSVYVQGAQALAALGDADGVDCALRHYVATQAFAVARPEHLRSALEVRFADAGATLAAFGAV